MIRKLFENWRRYLEEDSEASHFPPKFYKFVEEINVNKKRILSYMSFSDRVGDRWNYTTTVEKIVKRLKRTPEFKNVSTASGSFRKTFFIDDDYVIKLAMELDAIEQNRQEVQIGRDSKYSKFFPKVYEADEHYIWLLVERVYPLYSDIPINNNLTSTLNNIREGTSANLLHAWLMMNWATAEFIRAGGLSEKNLRTFVEDIISGKTYGHLRFDDFFHFIYILVRRIGIGDEFSLKHRKEVQEMHKNFPGKILTKKAHFDEVPEEELIQAVKSLVGQYQEAALSDKWTGSFINLAVELPEMEIWDLRLDNLGTRSDGSIVILDSSFNITRKEQ